MPPDPTTDRPPSGGVTVWLTGLPSSGKTTLARGLASRLAGEGIDHHVLDGDEIREYLSKGLGFTREDRDENVRRIGFVASLLTGHGTVTICPVISPYAQTRLEVRELHGSGEFMEVFIATPVEICEERDVKGLYAKARAGEIASMTGIDDPYEAPENPDLVIHAGTMSLEDSVDLLFKTLAELLGR